MSAAQAVRHCCGGVVQLVAGDRFAAAHDATVPSLKPLILLVMPSVTTLPAGGFICRYWGEARNKSLVAMVMVLPAWVTATGVRLQFRP